MDTLSIGKHNPRLASIRKAIDKGTLTSEGLLPIEGPKLVREAQASGLEIVAVFLRQGAPTVDLPIEMPVYALDAAAFKGIQSTETSQGIVALVRPRRFEIQDVIGNPLGPIVVLAGLQDPGNVGTILRVAESFGAAGCLGLEDTAAVYNSKVVRASAGSVFRIPHVWDLTLENVVGRLRSAGIQLIGTSPRGEESIAGWAGWGWRKPVAILIGNEGSGLAEDQIRLCDATLRIPQRPEVESLNSAVAAAVILYEAFKHRGLS